MTRTVFELWNATDDEAWFPVGSWTAYDSDPWGVVAAHESAVRARTEILKDYPTDRLEITAVRRPAPTT